MKNHEIKVEKGKVSFQFDLDEILNINDFKKEVLEAVSNTKAPNLAAEVKLLKGAEVDAQLGISRVTRWHWEKKGILKFIRLGNLKRYRKTDIDDLLKKQEVNNG